MRVEGKVITNSSPLNIRSGPGINNTVVGSLPKSSIVILVAETNVGGSKWYKLDDGRGWVSGNYISVIKNLDESQSVESIKESEITTPEKPKEEVDITNTSKGIDTEMLQKLYDIRINTKNEIDASTRLFGCPFQFIKQTDFRIDNTLDLGRKYLENIVAESPIVYFLPGRPSYLPDLHKNEKESLNNFFINNIKDNDNDKKTLLNSILGEKEVRYFDFISDYVEYMKYVNLLCRICSIYIGIEDKNVPGTTTKYKFYDWSNYKYLNSHRKPEKNKNKIFDMDDIKDDLQEMFFGEDRYVQFYVDPSTSFSESASNNTRESMFKGILDEGSDFVKEYSFLTNTFALKNLDEARDFASDKLKELQDKLNNGENFFSKLLGLGNKVLEGSNIVFPEIWGDASYGKSYSITINLITPYGDKESWFLNIGVPLMHLLALSLPRQTTPNSFSSPFLVKVFAKGWFSCEIGIVDSISIEKAGGGDAWTIDGLPSEVRVSIGVRDLYNNLMISPMSKPGLFFQNQGLIDFLAVTCGVNVTKPNLALKMETIFTLLTGKVMDIPSNFYKGFIENVRNSVEGLWKL